jgi:hypothetical protein
MYLGLTEPFCEPLLLFLLNPASHAPVGLLELVMGRTCREGGILLRRVPRHSRRNRLNGYGCKNRIRRFLRGRRDAGKTTPLSWTRRRSPDLSHTLHPNAAPIFSYENVFLRSRGFREPARGNDARTISTTGNDGAARDSIIIFRRRRTGTQTFSCFRSARRSPVDPSNATHELPRE